MKNLYNILNIPNTSSPEDIKKAYKLLARKYHPDKNKEDIIEIANEKFKEIQYAYQILMDEDKRREYDDMNNNDREIFNEMFMNFIKGAKNVLYEYLKASFQIKHENSVESFSEENYIDSIMSIDELNDLDIIINLEVDLIEKYLGKKKKIKYTNQKYIDNEYKLIENNITIELNSNQLIFYDCGDEYDNRKGNLIINIVAKNNKNYRVNGNDLIKKVKISLYEYIYGIDFILDHFNERIKINIDNPIHELASQNKEFYYKVSNKGLNSKEGRGDLYINFKLIIKNQGSMDDQELLKYYYPVITK
jgi:DnaJ-class molecular chaperone